MTDTVENDALAIAISGDLDLLTASACACELTRALADRPPECRVVVLDMRGVGFCGAVGIRMLRTFAGHCAELGLYVCILAGKKSVVRRIVELAELEEVLPVVDDVTAATNWLPLAGQASMSDRS
ncbi:STAS domain-containing protein [Labedaea rhizosphaerae]|uniref:STAS domain-containing protein n=1 Tax=Labedaea rhizosphaerae TaxID=598644 RepID=UPI001414DDE9|nr:STAS domain-containing protein [Labedaea rhizosphaerae]